MSVAYKILSGTAAFSVLIPFSIGLWKWKSGSKIDKSVILFVVAGLLMELVSQITKNLGKNHFVAHIDMTLNSVFLCWYFVLLLKDKRTSLIVAVGAIMIISTEIYELYTTGINSFNSLTRFVSSALLTTLGLRHFLRLLNNRKLVKSQRPINIHLKPTYWYTLSILLLFSCSALHFAFLYTIVENHPAILVPVWMVYLSVLIISRAALIIGLLRITETKPMWP